MTKVHHAKVQKTKKERKYKEHLTIKGCVFFTLSNMGEEWRNFQQNCYSGRVDGVVAKAPLAE